MAFPILLVAIGGLVTLLIGASITYLTVRLLKLRPVAISIADISRQARFVVVLLVLELATITAYRFSRIEPPITFQPFDVYVELFRSGVVILAPLAFVMRLSRQTLGSVGVRNVGIVKMVGLGLPASLAVLALTGQLALVIGAEFAGLTPLAYGFAIFLPSGLSEDIVWIGYLQTRLIARTTMARGLLVTSLIFSLWHLPVNFLTYGGLGKLSWPLCCTSSRSVWR